MKHVFSAFLAGLLAVSAHAAALPECNKPHRSHGAVDACLAKALGYAKIARAREEANTLASMRDAAGGSGKIIDQQLIRSYGASKLAFDKYLKSYCAWVPNTYTPKIEAPQAMTACEVDLLRMRTAQLKGSYH
ncbi:hypothetical protein [Crenobacter cavernae]|uniref:DUF1311 domain-containing protein n=1 Tax=Crenobacter cavernae TaxID=2290923 RepID=A0A345Y4K2_9NEIS|nr:hypothetical protein [Crenobacter cavernae]AXK38854.1 hypothetical protein DWG20_05075 [Crenobacter cavernae]